MNESLKMINPIELNHSLTILARTIEFNREFLTEAVNTVLLGENDYLHFKEDGTVLRTTFYEPETWILRANKPLTAHMENSFNIP